MAKPITRNQVDALFEEIIACKPVQYVCKGILGKGSVPELSDFTSRNAADLLKCERFLTLLKDAAKMIEVDVKGRERQGEMFDPQTNAPMKPKKKPPAKKKSGAVKSGKKKASAFGAGLERKKREQKKQAKKKNKKMSQEMARLQRLAGLGKK